MAVSQRVGRMALVLSFEARWCPHDPDLRMPMGCHQENTKDTGDRGARDQCSSHSQYRLAFGETSFRILEKMTRQLGFKNKTLKHYIKGPRYI